MSCVSVTNTVEPGGGKEVASGVRAPDSSGRKQTVSKARRHSATRAFQMSTRPRPAAHLVVSSRHSCRARSSRRRRAV